MVYLALPTNYHISESSSQISKFTMRVDEVGIFSPGIFPLGDLAFWILPTIFCFQAVNH